MNKRFTVTMQNGKPIFKDKHNNNHILDYYEVKDALNKYYIESLLNSDPPCTCHDCKHFKTTTEDHICTKKDKILSFTERHWYYSRYYIKDFDCFEPHSEEGVNDD